MDKISGEIENVNYKYERDVVIPYPTPAACVEKSFYSKNVRFSVKLPIVKKKKEYNVSYITSGNPFS